MFTYEGGVAVAFFLWFYQAVILLVQINSRLERNLNKIGQRLSWLTLTPKQIESPEAPSVFAQIGKYLLVVTLGFLSALLSWLYVLIAVGMFIYAKSKDSGAPASVREYRWKLRNLELTVDDLLREGMKVSGQDPLSFEQVRSELEADMQSRGLTLR
jgi:hypothetical protein